MEMYWWKHWIGTNGMNVQNSVYCTRIRSFDWVLFEFLPFLKDSIRILVNWTPNLLNAIAFFEFFVFPQEFLSLSPFLFHSTNTLFSLNIQTFIHYSLILFVLYSNRRYSPHERQQYLRVTRLSQTHPASTQQPQAALRTELSSESSEQNGSNEPAERFNDVVISERSVESARRNDGREKMNESSGENFFADSVERDAEQKILRADQQREREKYNEERRSWTSFPMRRRRSERRTRGKAEKWRERKGVMKNSVRNM